MSKRKASEFFKEFEDSEVLAADTEKRSYHVDTTGSRPILKSRWDDASPVKVEKPATAPVALDEFGRIAKPGTKEAVSLFLKETVFTPKTHSRDQSKQDRLDYTNKNPQFPKGKVGLGFTESRVESRGRGKASTLPAWMTANASNQGITSWETETKVSVPGDSWMRADMQQASSILINEEFRVTGMSDARGLKQVNKDARRGEMTRAINDDGVFSIRNFYEHQKDSTIASSVSGSGFTMGSDLAHHDAIFTAVTNLDKPTTASNAAPHAPINST
jgi:hypothetical protein